MLKLYVGVKEYKSSLPSFEFHHSQLAIYLFHFLYKIIKKKKNWKHMAYVPWLVEKKKWNTKSDTKYFYSISNNINQQFYNALNIFDYKFMIKRNNLKQTKIKFQVISSKLMFQYLFVIYLSTLPFFVYL